MATHNSPKGRPVEIVGGNPGNVEQRGHQIVRIGAIMREGHGILTNVVTQGLEASMTGKSVEKLAEASREVYTELDLAATLYEEVGPYVENYGKTVGEVKSRMTTIVPAAESAWSAYQSRVSDYEDAMSSPVRVPPVMYPAGSPSPDPDPETVRRAEELHEQGVDNARAARDRAFEAWQEQGDAFDHQYDTWQTAYATAVAGVRTEVANGIQDSWQDDLDGFVSDALFVLQIAGVVLAVLALVVGGPIVALLGAIVGVLTLIGTIWQFSRGDANGWDLALAIVGVIPFGAFGEAFSAFRAGGNGFAAGFRSWLSVTPVSGNSRLWADIATSFADDAARWGNAFMSGRQFFSVLTSNGQTITSIAQFVSGQTDDMWRVIGDLGTMGEQAAYGLTAPGVFIQNLVTIHDIVDLGVDLFT